MAIVAPVPQVSQECVQWSVSVRSAHEDRENTHQRKIAACISFPVKTLKNKAKKQDDLQTSSQSSDAFAAEPSVAYLTGGINAENHLHRSRVHPLPDGHDSHELWRRRDHP